MAGGLRRRPLGRTGLEVTELGLGTWGLSGEAYGPVSVDEAMRTLVRAQAMGLTLFETSASYGRGGMEIALGKALAGKEDVVVVTKLGTDRSVDPPEKSFDAEFLRKAAKTSRERIGTAAKLIALLQDVVVVTKLGTDRSVDPPEKSFDAEFLRKAAKTSRERIGTAAKLIALLHHPSRATVEAGVAAETMASLTEEGVIDSWGVSGDDEPIVEAAIAAGAPVVSLAYNILKVQPLRALEARLREAGIGVLAHSVLAYGLLAGRWAPGREFRQGDHRRERFAGNTVRKRLRHLDAVRPLVSGDVANIRAAALRFALANEAVSSVVLGPKSSAQLDQLLRDCNGVEPPYLSRPKLEALEQRLI